MNAKELVEKIKKQLASLVSKEEVKFAQIQVGEMTVSTKDDQFTVGSEVFTIDQDGNNIPLADGEYKADDGTKMVVVGGKITEIGKEEGEKPEVEVSIESGDYKKDEKETDMEKRMANIEMALEAMAKKMEEMMGKSETMMKEFSKIAEQPSTKSIEPVGVEFRDINEKKSTTGMPDVLAIREKLRKNR